MHPTTADQLLKETDDRPESPRHGDQGDREAAIPTVPEAISVAVSREAGARGGATGRRVGKKLGWQVYDQELLEYMAQDVSVRGDVETGLTAEAAAWVDARLDQLQSGERLSRDPAVVNLARVVLSLGAQGEVVLIGRGAGFLLPRSTTLHVRMIAPLKERVAYMSQWLRLPEADAAVRVRDRDERRSDFIRTHFRRDPDDVHFYDLLLNASRLGEDVCAELIAQAARARAAQHVRKG
jgi:cytidylate kinase